MIANSRQGGESSELLQNDLSLSSGGAKRGIGSAKYPIVATRAILQAGLKTGEKAC